MLRIAMLLLFGSLAAPQAAAQGAKELVGTWRLVEVEADPSMNWGPRPSGLIYYDANGYMAAQIMPDRPRRKYAGEQPTPEEAKQAISGYTAYFGTYTVDEKTRTVLHKRLGNINPGFTDNTVVRRYKFVTPDRIVLGDKYALTWERVKAPR